ncbi:unnamed protein product [Orchesella dallaii]|uniref:Uncharacterized protein n=1 Tax=Orchesella dallaii TaxID=48710 RepID=A0ABP1RWL5_9HEXA
MQFSFDSIRLNIFAVAKKRLSYLLIQSDGWADANRNRHTSHRMKKKIKMNCLQEVEKLPVAHESKQGEPLLTYVEARHENTEKTRSSNYKQSCSNGSRVFFLDGLSTNIRS